MGMWMELDTYRSEKEGGTSLRRGQVQRQWHPPNLNLFLGMIQFHRSMQSIPNASLH